MWSGSSWTSPCGDVSDTSIQEENLGRAEDSLDRFYLSASLGTSPCPQEESVDVTGQKNIWIFLLRLFPCDLEPY